jgi:phosphopantetheinyl transferase
MEEGDKRRPPEETIATCRARLGEKGYSIFYNNCEHFAYECVMGEKKSTQMDFVRNFFRSMKIVDVYTASIPKLLPDAPLYPEERQKEVLGCGHGGVKRQKYYVWRLLEYALDRTFGYKMKTMAFSKNKRGKWETPTCYFSLSHCDDMVAVAVSRDVVGVDIEDVNPFKDEVLFFALTLQEMEECKSLPKEDRLEYLYQKWTTKESVFKTQEEGCFHPAKMQASDYSAKTKTLRIADKTYVLTVATADVGCVRYYENIDLEKATGLH